MKRILALAVSALLISPVVAGCAIAPEGPKPECVPSASGPGDTTQGSGLYVKHPKSLIMGMVVGNVWIYCDPSPEEHHLTIEVWFQPDGSIENWHRVGLRKTDSIPGPAPQPFSVVGPVCVPGDYYLKWHTIGVSSQGEPFVSPEYRGNTITFSKADCGLHQ